ncbi:MAG: hypothetical protein ABIF09_18180, partial [Gemmatimonadota bacterium]
MPVPEEVEPRIPYVVEQVRRYRAFPIQNVPAVKSPVAKYIFLEEEQGVLTAAASEPVASYPLIFIPKRREYYSGFTGLADVGDPSPHGRFLPSPELAIAFLRASERLTEHFRAVLSFLPQALFKTSRAADDRMVEKVRQSIAERVHGSLEGIAYRAAAFEGRTVTVADTRGEFVESLSRELAEHLPVRTYELPGLLRML